MSRTWDTKRKILDLVSEKQMNVSEISSALGLSVSTASQHLADLKRIGAVSEVDNPFIKKWKYYKANKAFNVDNFVRGAHMHNTYKIAIGAALVLVAIGAIAALALSNSSGNNITFSLTDPPVVPNGTTALLITYSSVQAHVVGRSNATASSWITASGNGTLDLMSLVNVTQVIGAAHVSANTTIDTVRFNVTSAKIVINGTTYNVTVPSSTVTARLNSAARANGTTDILIDLSPVVASIITNNSTVFVMVPSVKAIVVSGATFQMHVGARGPLQAPQRGELKNATPIMQVAGASISQGNGTTQVSITVRNTANQSIMINHVSVFGNFTITVSPFASGGTGMNVNAIARIGNAPGAGANGSRAQELNISDQAEPLVIDSIGGSSGFGIGASASGSARMNGGNAVSVHSNVNATANATASSGESGQGGYEAGRGGFRTEGSEGIEVVIGRGNSMLNQSFNATVRNLVDIGARMKSMRVVTFLVSSNGSLFLPAAEDDFFNEGFVLPAGGSATLTFNAPIAFGNGRIGISAVPGDNYSIVVQGEEGARVDTSVAAK